MILLGLLLFFLIRQTCEHFSGKGAESSRPHKIFNSVSSPDLVHLLAILVIGKLLDFLLVYLGQPQVIGEVVAGICLGPTLLGWLVPGSQELLSQPSLLPSLNALAQLEILLYMFLVGLELDLQELQSQVRITLFISHASI